jgi:intracellular multiplication protein IcmK
MRPTTFHWACVALALASPATAQQSASDGASASLSSGATHEAGVESAIPLTPNMIRDLGRRVGDNKRAEEEANTEIASPISRRVNVSFAPGQSTSIIRIVKGYPTALSFFDRTGQPWPIEWDTNSNPAGQANNGNCNQGPAGGAGPAVASAGFYVCTPTVGSNVLQVAAASLQPRGGLLVTLKGAPKPISFMLVAGGGAYDADLTVQVAERGPNAKGVATGPVAPDTASPFLTAMLDGAPPAEAEPLAVAGVSPDDLRAWKVGNRVVARLADRRGRRHRLFPAGHAGRAAFAGWRDGFRVSFGALNRCLSSHQPIPVSRGFRRGSSAARVAGDPAASL